MGPETRRRRPRQSRCDAARWGGRVASSRSCGCESKVVNTRKLTRCSQVIDCGGARRAAACALLRLRRPSFSSIRLYRMCIGRRATESPKNASGMHTRPLPAVPGRLRRVQERRPKHVPQDYSQHHDAHELVLRSQRLPALARRARDQASARRGASSGLGGASRPAGGAGVRVLRRLRGAGGPALDVCSQARPPRVQRPSVARARHGGRRAAAGQAASCGAGNCGAPGAAATRRSECSDMQTAPNELRGFPAQRPRARTRRSAAGGRARATSRYGAACSRTDVRTSLRPWPSAQDDIASSPGRAHAAIDADCGGRAAFPCVQLYPFLLLLTSAVQRSARTSCY